MLARRIVRHVLIVFGDIFKIRDLRSVEFHQHIRRRHPLDKIVRRDDHVIALITRAKFGKQLVIAGKQGHVHIDAARFLVIFERRLADISIPVVEVQFGLFAIGELFRLFLATARQCACQRKPNGGNAHALEHRAAVATCV